jgi:hypothetical protein
MHYAPDEHEIAMVNDGFAAESSKSKRLDEVRTAPASGKRARSIARGGM